VAATTARSLYASLSPRMEEEPPAPPFALSPRRSVCRIEASPWSAAQPVVGSSLRSGPPGREMNYCKADCGSYFEVTTDLLSTAQPALWATSDAAGRMTFGGAFRECYVRAFWS
jgi:hypothetical protein